MFQIGDSVMYGAHGVCRITASEMRRVDRKNLTYLVLEPLDKETSRYYVPIQNEAAMGKLRSILSQKELEDLLESAAIREDGWIADENRRKLAYKETLSSGDRESLLRMLHSTYRQRDALTAAGRKLHMCDDNFMRDAEKVLISEIAATLELSQADARDHLREKLGG